METRKIQATGGGGTYILSLPKKWIESNKIKRKDNISVFTREDGALVILPEKEKNMKDTKAIYAKGKPVALIKRKIIGAYINGSDSIEIIGSIPWKDMKNIKAEAKKMLIGVEMTEEKDRLSVHCILDVSKLSIKNILEKAYKTTNWMYDNAFLALAEKNRELAEDVVEQDSEVDRLAILAIRQLNSALKDPAFAELVDISGLGTLDYRAVVDYVEIMADCCVNIASAVIKIMDAGIPEDIKANIISISKKVNRIYSDVVYAFRNKEVVLANSAIEQATKTDKEIFSAEGKSVILTDKRLYENPGAVGAIAILLENMGYIMHLSRSVGELVIDRGSERNESV